MIALSRDFRRFLAVALLLAAVLAVHVLVIEPVINAHRRLDAAWTGNSNLLANYSRITAALGSLREAQTALENDANAVPAYLTAPSLTLAATELQNRLNATMQRHKAQLIGPRVLDPVEEGAFQRIGMRITLTATLAPLQAILYDLESGVPFLFIDELTIQRQEGRPQRRTATSSLQAAPDPQLDVSFNLLAYLRKS
jgi:general secretion pathway protein M